MSEWITKFRRRGQSVQKFHSSETINCFALANTANTPVKMINKRDERTKGIVIIFYVCNFSVASNVYTREDQHM